MRPDLSTTSADLSQTLNQVVSLSKSQNKIVQEKASYLNRMLSGKVEGTNTQSSSLREGVSNSVSFREVGQSAEDAPFISAIVTEDGIPSVYLRKGKEDVQILTVGDDWNGWTLKIIEPSRVYFANEGENFDYLVFANLGKN